ncbi:WD-repeat protein, putative [Perkinsus marinus ATCC 50983]|uniref:WD-repeat protein, putative n=1 Tax=Perkinsus marinus (strain ATCC 50983 / TXsc) TaxID=423536 RepID=C5M0T4_PERM5|nr:WD-repeat protein, putative [Perkinsus marinus ATCC 50983]EEQ97442.1 WD-repeat protein, putative [Perkinsus marinus ATCC 50983]|eukprot:XP_002764725.1 WD-repeat protein, putative [Perkinsus marinus ATCC 50983]
MPSHSVLGMLDVALVPTTGSGSGVFVIDVHTGAITRQLKDSTSTTVVLTADGYVCAAQSNKGLLHYWKMTDAGLDDDDEDNLRGVSSNPCYKCSTPEKLCSLLFSDGPAQLLIAGGVSGTIYVWQLSTGRLMRTWKAHYSGVTQMRLTADASFLVTASLDTTVKVFTLSSLITSGGGGGGAPSPARVFRGHTLPVHALDILQEAGVSEPSRILISSGSADGSVKIWEFTPGGSGRQVATFNLPTPVHHIALSPRGPLYVGGDDGRVHVIDIQSKEINVLTGSHGSALLGLGCSVDGSRVVSVAADGLRIWDVFSGQTIKQVSTAQLSLQSPCGLTMLSRVDFMRHPSGSVAPRFQALQRVLTPVDDLEALPVPSRKTEPRKTASIRDVFEIDLERERERSPVSCLTYGLLEDVFASPACDEAVSEANRVRDKWQNVAFTLYQQGSKQGGSSSSSSATLAVESSVVIPPAVMEPAAEATKEPEAPPKEKRTVKCTVGGSSRPKRKAAKKSIKKKKA